MHVTIGKKKTPDARLELATSRLEVLRAIRLRQPGPSRSILASTSCSITRCSENNNIRTYFLQVNLLSAAADLESYKHEPVAASSADCQAYVTQRNLLRGCFSQ